VAATGAKMVKKFRISTISTHLVCSAMFRHDKIIWRTKLTIYLTTTNTSANDIP